MPPSRWPFPTPIGTEEQLVPVIPALPTSNSNSNSDCSGAIWRAGQTHNIHRSSLRFEPRGVPVRHSEPGSAAAPVGGQSQARVPALQGLAFGEGVVLEVPGDIPARQGHLSGHLSKCPQGK